MHSKVNKNQGVHNSLVYVDKYYYRQKDVIGEGYSSTVYKGYKTSNKNDKHDKNGSEAVAIKKIKSEPLKNSLNKKLLQSEISSLHIMKGSKNIIDVCDIIEEDNGIFIITQLCQSDLEKKIKQRINFKQAQKFMNEIISGFRSLLEKQIVHRDLKPNNILVDKNGSLKIGDFGFAINAQEARKQTMYNIGSPLYMAPQSLSKNQYSHTSDVWSIGVIAYELFAAKTPWTAKTEVELIKVIKENPIEAVMKKQKIAMPPNIKKLIIETLQYDKTQRLSPKNLADYDFGKHKKPTTPDNTLKKSKYSVASKTEKKINNYVQEMEDGQKTNRKTMSYASSLKIKKERKVTLAKQIQQDHKKYQTTPKKGNFDGRPKTSSIIGLNKKMLSTQKAMPTGSYCMVKQGHSLHKGQKKFGDKIKEKASQQISKTQAQKLIDDKINVENPSNSNKTALIYEQVNTYIIIYQMLYKITQDISSSKLLHKIDDIMITEKQRLLKSYCSLISKIIYKIKDFSKSNLFKLSPNIMKEFLSSIEFRKITKANNHNLQNFSKAKHLIKYWKDSQQPNFQFAVNASSAFINKFIQNFQKQLNPHDFHHEILILKGLGIMKQVLTELKKSGYAATSLSLKGQMLKKYLVSQDVDKLPDYLQEITTNTTEPVFKTSQ